MAHYRRTYLCLCAGQQETMYLDHVARLIKDFPRKAVKFNSSIDEPYRLERVYQEYDSAALFDFDFNEVEFKRNIEICDRLNRIQRNAAGQKRRYIYHAYSNVNFDLWLILHKEDFRRQVTSNKGYFNDVRRIYNLDHQDNIKNKGVIKKILRQITLNDVKAAINRADQIKNEKLEEDAIIVGNTKTFTNPDFSLHEFLKVVLKDSGDL